MLGIPDRMRACLFDLDGVLTQTAQLHAAAWKAMFDDYLRRRAERTGAPFVPFDLHADYDTYVDGKPRADGTASFLASRQITLPLGHSGDTPGTETVHGLGNAKNLIVLRMIADEGVGLIPGSLRYLQAVRDAGPASAVVSSSHNRPGGPGAVPFGWSSAMVLASAIVFPKLALGLSGFETGTLVMPHVKGEEGDEQRRVPEGRIRATRKLRSQLGGLR